MATMGKKYSKNKKQKQEVAASGIHVYRDEKDRPIYYDVFTKIGYVIDGYEKSFRPYALRFFLGLFAGILMYMFNFAIYLSAIVGVGVYVFMEIKFRLFLRKLPHILNYKPKKRIGAVESTAEAPSGNILTKVFLYGALAVLIVANGYMKNFDTLYMVFCWIISVIGVYFMVIQILALNLQKKNGTFSLKK